MNEFWIGVGYSIVFASILTVAYSAYWAMRTFRWFVREYANRTEVMALSAGLVERKER